MGEAVELHPGVEKLRLNAASGTSPTFLLPLVAFHLPLAAFDGATSGTPLVASGISRVLLRHSLITS